MSASSQSTQRQQTDAPLQEAATIELTPEQKQRIELNRLKAKVRQRERERVNALASSSSDTANTSGKRPLGVTPAVSNSPTAPNNASGSAAKDKPLRRDARLGKYFDYDLSKMVNSKGGFLVEDEKEDVEERLARQRERERERARKNIEPGMSLDPNENPRCVECKTVDIDHQFRITFKVNVCKKCTNEHPEKYSLLTKTECKEDYLLTDPELRDEDLMPHMLKQNPHKATYSNMMLFLRCQVETFAWTKWGSPEALDAEFERREEKKKKKKSRKFEEGLRELRRRTRETVWQRRKDEEHKHVFGGVERGPDGVGKQVCHICGFTIDGVEEF